MKAWMKKIEELLGSEDSKNELFRNTGNWFDKNIENLGFSLKFEKVLKNFNVLFFKPTHILIKSLQEWDLTAFNWILLFRNYIEQSRT